MLNRKLGTYLERVWSLAGEFGNCPAKIADALLREVFPDSCETAEREGCLQFLRAGVVEDVRRILRRPVPSDAQADFDSINEAFRPIVQRLHNRTYSVPGREDYVTVPDLIADPELLDRARKALRAHGEATLAEAAVLDELYRAVVARPA